MVLMKRIAVLVLGMALAVPSMAGEDSESHVSRPGLFFAWLAPDDGAVVVRSDDAAQLRDLARHCNAGREVFALQGGAKYRCRIDVSKSPSGAEQWDAVSATVQGGGARSDTETRQYRLFSTQAPRTARWTTRRIAATEVQALERLGGAAKKPAQLGAATVVQRPGGQGLAILVPGQWVEDRDAHYRARRHHVFTQDRSGGRYAYRGEVPAQPASFVDIDGADLPGLVVSEGCDGWCISLWSLAGGGLRQVGRFGGH